MTMTTTHQTTADEATTMRRGGLMLGSLYALLLANSVQIGAGLAQLEVSPPTEVLPLLAATMAVGIAAVPMIRAGDRHGLQLGIVFCVLSLIGMGPHKLFLEDGLVIAPMALTGFAFEVVFVRAAVRSLRERD